MKVLTSEKIITFQLHLVKIVKQRESQGKCLQRLALLRVGREREKTTPTSLNSELLYWEGKKKKKGKRKTGFFLHEMGKYRCVYIFQ